MFRSKRSRRDNGLGEIDLRRNARLTLGRVLGRVRGRVRLGSRAESFRHHRRGSPECNRISVAPLSQRCTKLTTPAGRYCIGWSS